MKAARKQLARFAACERGATVVEYGLICALMVLAVVGSISALGSATGDKYNSIAEGFPEA